jgi:hypothetical protein
VRLYKLADDKKLETLKKLDPYDKSKIDDKTKKLKWNDPTESEILKNFVDANERESQNEVKWDFEHVGILFDKGAIPKEEFLKAYWRIVIICWTVLCEKVMCERQKQQESYMSHFGKLCKAAEKYQESNHSDEKIDIEKIKEDYNE